MPFAEDAHLFLAEFSKDCVSNGTYFKALVDEDDDFLNGGNHSTSSCQYKLTFVTSDVVLKRGDVIEIIHHDGTANERYKTREPAKRYGDGTFSTVALTDI